jgi:hypothetical protein
LFRKTRVAVAALSAVGLTLVTAGMASAAHTDASVAGGYHNTQVTGGTQCNDRVDEGIISAKIKGWETRMDRHAFREGATVVTLVHAQIQLNGEWFNTGGRYVHTAHGGIIHRSGGMYVKPWVYDGRGTHPRFGADVAPVGYYRIIFVSELWYGGIEYGSLRTVNGYCKFV